MKRKNYFSGAPMELVDGYSRMVQAGPFLLCGGTTSVQPDGSMIAEGDSYGQVQYVLNKLIGIIGQAGGAKEDIYSVKIYSTPDYDRKAGLRAFAEIFGDTHPVLNEVTIEKLTRPTQLVEIEMNAIAGCAQGVDWNGILLKKEVCPATCEDGKTYGYSSRVTVGPFVYLAAKSGSNDAEILEKLRAELAAADCAADDIVKLKRYATEAYESREPFAYDKVLSMDKIAFSSVIVEDTNSEGTTEKLEAFAIRGCGGETCPDAWGSVDFRKKCIVANFVQTGPFLYAGTLHSLDENGVVVGVGDSEIQESYVAESLTTGMKAYGYVPTDLVKFKGYYTKEFGSLYGETETPYYERVYKPVKPLYTGVYVSRVGIPDEIFEMEMTAIKGLEISDT